MERDVKRDKKPDNFEAYTLYRIFYGNDIVYVGRTMQPLQSRLHAHFFKKRLVRAIDIDKVSLVEYSTYKTKADMYLYEIYFINLYKPMLNCDDLAHDSLSVTLPAVEWKEFTTPLWDKWKAEIGKRDKAEETAKQHYDSVIEKNRQMRRAKIKGEITEDEYWEFYDKEVAPYKFKNSK